MILLSLILSAIFTYVPASGKLRVPCIMVEFQDVKFSQDNAREYFDNMMNGESGVRQYYLDNSLGAFETEFDVYGPVTLDKYRAFYGRDVIVDGQRADAAADQALAEACRILDPDVDFSQYDRDQDGVLDVALYIYAGHDQAQGGPFEAIWAHQWYLSMSANQDLKNVVLDGVRLDSYACSAQYRGSEGKDLSGIGVMAHEFGHALGLPDFYDTDSKEAPKAADLSNYALMCNGTFNNNGFTPPYMTAMERMILGWLDKGSLTELAPGYQTLSAIRHNTAYIIPTEIEDEYFVLEYRDSKGWDAPLPEGLAVYHVDKSGDYSQRWENWREPGMGINGNPEHPCCYLVQALPGPLNRLSIEPLSWSGSPVQCQVTCVEINGQGLGLYAQFGCGANVNGYVRDTYGHPVSGAAILLDQAQAVSGEDGHFMVECPDEAAQFTLAVSAQGFRDFRTTVSMDGERVVSVPVTLRQESEGEDFVLRKYDNHLTRGYYSKAGIGAVRFGPGDLAPYAGCLLKEIVFYPYLLTSFTGEIYVTVDIGTERVLTKQVESLCYGAYFTNSIDVADEGIVIPEGEDVYIGYGSESSGENAFFVGTVYPGEKKNSYWSPFSKVGSTWSPMYVERAGITMNLALQAHVQEQMDAASLEQLGYAYIKDSPELELVTPVKARVINVTWYLDGSPVSGTLDISKGRHVVEAHVTYESGIKEVIRKVIDK